ncbi:SipW-dependent-type signal peptide-containing protein [Geoglobus acetivorans]|uniref:SipW-cognate class signal peptide n=1 Tax=Geoglobus acetivorans TaxID=565033 RepID=A0A0A7GFT4_GEOAI|nr:hypothetical protein GACE_0737 [Geoglobus acetivorans]
MRSVAAALILISLVLAGAGYGTWAIYQDTETSSGNYVQAGTLDIYLTDHTTDANQQWLVLNSYPRTDEDNPGQSSWMGSGQIKVHNDGSLRGDHIELAFKFKCYEDDDGDVFVSPTYPYDFTYDSSKHTIGPESDTNQSGIGDWLKEIKLTKLNYGLSSNRETTYNLLNGLCMADGDSECTMNDLALSVIKLPSDYTPLTDGNEYGLIQMDFEIIDTGTPQNDWQGDVCELIVQVALAQDPSQTVLSPGGVEVILPSSN